MPPGAKRTLTRVEREWTDFPLQPLDDLFTLSGTASEKDAQTVGEGLAWTRITWYMTMAKPVRRRNVKQLLDRCLPLPGHWRASLAQATAADEAVAFDVLWTFMDLVHRRRGAGLCRWVPGIPLGQPARVRSLAPQ